MDSSFLTSENCAMKYQYITVRFFAFKEFVAFVKELKEYPTLRDYITTNTEKFVGEHHSIERESKTYKWLVEKPVSSLQQYQTGLNRENSKENQKEQPC